MSYGGAMDSNNGPNYGKVSLNKDPNDKSVDRRANGAQVEMTYSDERDIAMELHLAKLEQDLAENKLKYKELEIEIDRNQQDFNYLTNKIIEAEREKVKIISEDPILEEIKNSMEDSGIFKNKDLLYGDPNRYKLVGDRNSRLGIIDSDPSIDQREIDMWDRKAKELDGDIYYNRSKLSKLKNLIEKDKERLKDGQEVANLGEDISVWD